LGGVHPHLPAAGSRLRFVVEAVGAAAFELGVAEVGDTAEHGGDPASRPPERVLDLGERPRLVGRVGQSVQQLAHEVAAAVVEALDLAGVIHRVMRRMLFGWVISVPHSRTRMTHPGGGRS